MKKIISLFQRNYDGDRLVRDEVVPGAEWVIAGEGVATRKWDGTCCMIRNCIFYKRCEWDAQKGPATASFLHWDFDPSQRSGHGWVPVGDDPGDWMHRNGFARSVDDNGDEFHDGTYELIGPRIGKNPEGVGSPVLVPHGRDVIHGAPRTFLEIREYLRTANVEGIVWHHPDGRMVKIKAKDFGIKRGAQ